MSTATEAASHADRFNDLWWNRLTAKQRKTRMEQAFIPLKRMAKKQIAVLDQYEQSDAPKEIGFHYFISTVKNVWENIDFAIEIGKGRFQRFSHFPTRTVLESLLRLEHYCSQNKDGQNDIMIREHLRIAKRFYEREKTINGTGEPYKRIYEDLASEGDYRSIEEANPKDDPFPNMKTMAERSPVYQDANLYFSYEALCELSHGKLLASNSAREDELGEHVRSMMELQALSCNLLKLVDHHIQGATAEGVTKAMNEAEAIVKAGM